VLERGACDPAVEGIIINDENPKCWVWTLIHVNTVIGRISEDFMRSSLPSRTLGWPGARGGWAERILRLRSGGLSLEFGGDEGRCGGGDRRRGGVAAARELRWHCVSAG
jgi:hypothetical protein